MSTDCLIDVNCSNIHPSFLSRAPVFSGVYPICISGDSADQTDYGIPFGSRVGL